MRVQKQPLKDGLQSQGSWKFSILQFYWKRDLDTSVSLEILQKFWDNLFYRAPLSNCFWELEAVAQELLFNKGALNIFVKFTRKYLCLSLFSIKLHKVLLWGSGLRKNNTVKLFRSFYILCFVLKHVTFQCLVEKSRVVKRLIWELCFKKLW